MTVSNSYTAQVLILIHGSIQALHFPNSNPYYCESLKSIDLPQAVHCQNS